jgi:regulatory protein
MSIGRKITGLKIQKHNPNRINVYLDGDFAFGLARIVAAWLKVGDIVSEDKISQLQFQDTREMAYQKALVFLNVRPRSQVEVEKRLVKYGFDNSIVEHVIIRLQDYKLISDEQFAKSWVENRTAFRPRSHKLMAIELRQKGVSDQIIVESIKEAGDEEPMAYQIASRYARRFVDTEWLEFRQRLGAYLMRRGFYYDLVSSVVQKVWNENKNRVEKKKSEDEELENEYT